eukprot:765683-Hanusia_phi.AAC.2
MSRPTAVFTWEEEIFCKSTPVQAAVHPTIGGDERIVLERSSVTGLMVTLMRSLAVSPCLGTRLLRKKKLIHASVRGPLEKASANRLTHPPLSLALPVEASPANSSLACLSAPRSPAYPLGSLLPVLAYAAGRYHPSMRTVNTRAIAQHHTHPPALPYALTRVLHCNLRQPPSRSAHRNI